jgi:hypothetical protein
MNQNLMNPEIVTRMAQMREQELRRETRGLSEAEGVSKVLAVPPARTQKRRPSTVFEVLFASLFH